MKARNEGEIAIGWHVENFAREGKKMKPLDHYMKPPLSPEQQRSQGAQGLRGMIARMKAKQEGGG